MIEDLLIERTGQPICAFQASLIESAAGHEFSARVLEKRRNDVLWEEEKMRRSYEKSHAMGLIDEASLMDAIANMPRMTNAEFILFEKEIRRHRDERNKELRSAGLGRQEAENVWMPVVPLKLAESGK